jgi:hypothetical protein
MGRDQILLDHICVPAGATDTPPNERVLMQEWHI